MNEVKPNRLSEKIILRGTIRALTGIHIGGTEQGLAIGGADKLVVRNPFNNEPYIPGSSIKGKMRSLLERIDCARDGCLKVESKGDNLACGPCKCEGRPPCPVCVAFGIPAEQAKARSTGTQRAGAARLIVRDAFLSNSDQLERMPNLDMPFTEVKTEVSIDRLTSAANPRQFERVPAGAEFRFEFVLNILDGDDRDGHIDLVKKALRLLGHDAIGGQVSRGYGQVEVRLETICPIPVELYADETKLRQAEQRNDLSEPLVYGGQIASGKEAA